jgi:hypothetical protein
MAMLGRGLDVVLLLPVDPVPVTDEPQLLEHVEGAIDGRRHRVRVEPAAAFDDLGPGEVPFAGRQDLDDPPALWRPAQAPAAEVAVHRGPWLGQAHRHRLNRRRLSLHPISHR